MPIIKEPTNLNCVVEKEVKDYLVSTADYLGITMGQLVRTILDEHIEKEDT